MEITEVFDECLEGVLAGRQTVEDCLAQYPELKDELESLLAVALAVHRTAPMAVSAHSASRMRENLQSRMASKQAQPAARLHILQSGVVRLAAALAVALSLGGGVMATAASSLPDAPLYPIKQASERVQLMMAQDPEERANLHLTFAERRLQEAESLSNKATEPDVVIESLARETDQALDALNNLPQDKKADLAEKIVGLEARQQQILTKALDKAPEDAQAGIQRALERSKRGHERAIEAVERAHEPDATPSENEDKQREQGSHMAEPTQITSPTPKLVSQPTSVSNNGDDKKTGESEKREDSERKETSVPTTVPMINPLPAILSPIPTGVPQPTATANRNDDDKSRGRDKPRDSEPRATVPPAPSVWPGSQSQPTSTLRKADEDKSKERDKRGDSDSRDKVDN